MPTNYKTWIIILALLSVAPIAVLMAQSLSESNDLPNGGEELNEGEVPGVSGPVGASGGTSGSILDIQVRCRDDDGFRIVSTGIVVDPECCDAAVIGEVENTCDRPLIGSVQGVFRNSRGTILSLGSEEVDIDRLEPGERFVFRIDFSTPIGWELAQQRGVRPRFNIRSRVVS